MKNTDSFAQQLTVRAVGAGQYEGLCAEASPGRGFGGIVLALAVSAAHAEAPADRPIHALHARFLRPVDASKSVTWTVAASSESRSFSRREVTGMQNGKAVLTLSASFALPIPGPASQIAMPVVQQPDRLVSERTEPVDVRHVEGTAVLEGRLAEPDRQRVWMKAASRLPDAPSIHAAAMAYMSDLTISWLVLSATDNEHARRHDALATAEASVWFHRQVRADDWLLYDQLCPSVAGGLGFVQGHLYSRDGTLAASVAQVMTMRL